MPGESGKASGGSGEIPFQAQGRAASAHAAVSASRNSDNFCVPVDAPLDWTLGIFSQAIPKCHIWVSIAIPASLFLIHFLFFSSLSLILYSIKTSCLLSPFAFIWICGNRDFLFHEVLNKPFLNYLHLSSLTISKCPNIYIHIHIHTLAYTYVIPICMLRLLNCAPP